MKTASLLLVVLLTTSANAQPLPWWEYDEKGKILKIEIRQNLTGIESFDFVSAVGGVEWSLPGLTRANVNHTYELGADTAEPFGFDWAAAKTAVEAGVNELTGTGVPISGGGMLGSIPLSVSTTWMPIDGASRPYLHRITFWVQTWTDSRFIARFNVYVLIPEPASGLILLIGLMVVSVHRTRAIPAPLR